MRHWRIGRRRRSRLHQNGLRSLWKRREEGSTLLWNVLLCFFVRTSNHQYNTHTFVCINDDIEALKKETYIGHLPHISSLYVRCFFSILCRCIVVVNMNFSIFFLSTIHICNVPPIFFLSMAGLLMLIIPDNLFSTYQR